ncbi:MAG: transcriptional repressor LexA [Lachnospiraceae bacterium]|nr:transcriptional repressor LexA [Lachnospiraceae bacterium]
MAKDKLSAKQEQILNFLKEEILTRGYPPTVREIGEAVGLRSTSSVYSQLENLERLGCIRRDPSKPRAIEIVDDEFNLSRRDMVSLPLVGQVAAGLPILAQQNIEDYFPVPAEYVPKNECFMLKVKGESMINAGIMNGDTIMVERCEEARDGQIIVALIDDSATVKTFYREKDMIRLQPENDTMSPIYVKNCQIIGRVFGVMRFLPDNL